MPSQGKAVEICLDRNTFTVADENGERTIDGHRYEFYTGTSQPDERSYELTGRRPVKTETVI